jgi:hypothetical protein
MLHRLGLVGYEMPLAHKPPLSHMFSCIRVTKLRTHGLVFDSGDNVDTLKHIPNAGATDDAFPTVTLIDPGGKCLCSGYLGDIAFVVGERMPLA